MNISEDFYSMIASCLPSCQFNIVFCSFCFLILAAIPLSITHMESYLLLSHYEKYSEYAIKDGAQRAGTFDLFFFRMLV